jgi:drug/metabolite transporter (DMT)-like permease
MKDSETTGSLAAIAAPFFMALGFIIWDKTWSKSGGSAFALNLYKCNLASIGFVVASLIFGFRIDDDETDSETIKESVGFLVLSGFIGIIVGDLAWLEALRQLGATRVIVLDCIKPFSAAFFGWIILGESIQKLAFSGIVLTVMGVLIVSLEAERKDLEWKHRSTSEIDEEDAQPNSENGEEDQLKNDSNDNEEDIIESISEEQASPSIQIKLKPEQLPPTITHTNTRTSQWNTRKGYILAVGNVFLDTYGSVLTKQHGKSFSSWTINLIRFASSGVIMFALSCFMCLYERKRPSSNKSRNSSTVPWYRLPQIDSQSWMKISIGVLFVTFLYSALNNYALFQISLGLALSLGSITPLYALFLEWPIYGEEKRPTLRSIGGATLAIGGVVILSIYNSEEK